MKLLILLVILGVAVAELPRFRPARFRFQRQELAPTTTDSPTEPTTAAAEGPYPPSGWKPSGEPFTLPKQEPAVTYGPPEQNGPYPPSGWKPEGQQFSLPNQPPSTSYGTPDNTYGIPETTEAPTTTDNPKAERLEGDVDVQRSLGTYYVLLPNGELQKVEYATENDVQNMKSSARLRLAPRAPLFLLRH